MKLRRLNLPQWLLAGERLVDLFNNALHSRQLTLTLGHLDTQRLNLENGDIASDNLALHILFVFDIESVYRALLLNLSGGLDRVVLEVTVFAFKRLEDNVAEERDAEQ